MIFEVFFEVIFKTSHWWYICISHLFNWRSSRRLPRTSSRCKKLKLDLRFQVQTLLLFYHAKWSSSVSRAFVYKYCQLKLQVSHTQRNLVPVTGHPEQKCFQWLIFAWRVARYGRICLYVAVTLKLIRFQRYEKIQAIWRSLEVVSK